VARRGGYRFYARSLPLVSGIRIRTDTLLELAAHSNPNSGGKANATTAAQPAST